MPDLDYLRIIKWTLIVLLAGFIGQFGKSFAKHLMERARLKRKVASREIEGTTSIGRGGGIEDVPGNREPPPSALSPDDTAKQDKKLAKTLAKQKKKEAKARSKQDKQ